MTLLKSKINSLAWLKSAIYISVVGGIILSSKSASAATFDFSEDPILGTVTLTEFAFGISDRYPIDGEYWTGFVDVIENRGPTTGPVSNDVLSFNGLLQHINAPHSGDISRARQFTFNFVLDASKIPDDKISYKSTQSLGHPAEHFDLFEANLSAQVAHGAKNVDYIRSWILKVEGEHKEVPEPTTIFGSALALGVGGWLKRKKSSQQNKAAPQH